MKKKKIKEYERFYLVELEWENGNKTRTTEWKPAFAGDNETSKKRYNIENRMYERYCKGGKNEIL